MQSHGSFPGSVIFLQGLQAPICAPDSICGYLQANVRGINYQRLCACPSGFPSCPMSWDSDDGHSVTQGSDQYKFCGRHPSLTTCEQNQAAYSTRMEYSKSTDELFAKVDRLHCVCPEDHNYVLAHQNWGEADPDIEAVEFSYTCALVSDISC
ncbi:hypothetical protein Ocin01_02734 [Orchesella cincta]|uniref:Uncharacterized protein n=1 Tax=Orchesella cincta TaxID=48709 RepID=A0A1D2NF91_ORCCI|nr:hypothetical protein Ocin01_02734 [Orchesella cincta]